MEEELPVNVYSIAELSGFFETSPTTIKRWIKKGTLIAEKTSQGYEVQWGEKNSSLMRKQREKMRNKFYEAYDPKELSEYSEWHKVLDELCWLFKVCYSPDFSVKRKKFRADIIFVRYIQIHKITLKKVKSIFSANQSHTLKAISDDLKRGWYNELAFVVPLKPSTLGLSFTDIDVNSATSSMRFAFPSWRVITAYYSIYFYLRGMSLQKFRNFRLAEHGATISTFKNNLLHPLSQVLWKFPLDITYKPGQRVQRRKLFFNTIRHIKFQYAYHPRTPHLSASGLYENIYKAYRKKARRSRNPTTYMLFDFLHDFRVWANYQNIDDMLSLWGTGYKAFIDQNLSLILFMIGGISEIAFIAVQGVDQYIQGLQKLYDLFAMNNPQLEREFTNTPIYQRYELYKEFGFVDQDLKLKTEFNPNTVIFLEEPKR
ncbi:MAG: hypothetical protein AABN95_24790 [Acidobacteriota bacterium]